jgi:hypothetical protein
MARLNEVYQEKVVDALMKRFNYKNRMQVPKLEKIIINMGLGEAIQNIKILDSAAQELSVITGREACHHQGEKIDCPIQIKDRNAHWMHGHSPERKNVRIFHALGECRPSEGEGFQRRLGQVF